MFYNRVANYGKSKNEKIFIKWVYSSLRNLRESISDVLKKRFGNRVATYIL